MELRAMKNATKPMLVTSDQATVYMELSSQQLPGSLPSILCLLEPEICVESLIHTVWMRVCDLPPSNCDIE
jgi:hypothetical protein